MVCRRYESIAFAYIDQQITQSEATNFRVYIENCGDCHAYMIELSEASLSLGSIQQPEIPAELRGQIMSAVRDK